MEPDIYQDCRDDDGYIRDPVFNEVIPKHRIITVQEGNHKWCFDALVLLEQVVLYNNMTNPMTRSQLPKSVLLNLFTYRMTQLYDITLVDNSKSLFATDNILAIKLDSFYLIGDLHISCAERLGKQITKVRVEIVGNVNGRNLVAIDTLNLNDSISTLTNDMTIELAISNGNVTGDSYNKLKKFVSDYDRYKFKFSPFPTEYVEIRSAPRSSLGTTGLPRSNDVGFWKPISLSQDEINYRSGRVRDRPISTYRYVWDVSGEISPVTVDGYRGEDMSYGRLRLVINRYNESRQTHQLMEQYLGPVALQLVELRQSLPVPYLTNQGEELTRLDLST